MTNVRRWRVRIVREDLVDVYAKTEEQAKVAALKYPCVVEALGAVSHEIRGVGGRAVDCSGLENRRGQ